MLPTMNGHRRVTRQAESAEPVSESGTRQTRRSARRAEASVEAESRQLPESKQQPEIPQRGTRRRRRRSLESVATNDFPKSSASRASPGPENKGLAPVSESRETDAVSEVGHAEELQDMDPDQVKDLLHYDIPKLMRWCNKMYPILSLNDSRHPEVHSSSSFRTARRGYNAARVPFDNDSPLFIKPIALPEYDPGVQAKVQAAVCSGNLVALLLSIVDVRFATSEPLPLLEQLDGTFPGLFNSGPATDTNEAERILDLGFRIRCRRLVETAASDVSIKSTIQAANLFCTREVRDVKSARAALNNGPYRKLAGMDINTNLDFHEACRSSIRGLASRLLPAEELGMLDEEYPRETLLDDLRLWALGIYHTLNNATEPSGAQVASPGLQPDAGIADGGSVLPPVDDNDQAREEEESDSGSDTDAGGYDQLPQQGASQNFIKDSATLAAIRQSEVQATASSVDASPSNRRDGKGTGNESDFGTAIRSLDADEILRRSQKRAGSSESDENEDNAFEVNHQLLDEPRRTGQRDAPIQQPPKRPRISMKPRTSSSQPLTPRIATFQRITGEHPLDDASDNPNLKERDIFVLSQGAQNTRRANIPAKPRQVRVPWTASDTSRLLDLIADPSLNCSWSAMEEEGGFEHYRNQQALRDKARSLKVWYLEDDRVLPAGFDQVALGQKEKNAVLRCRKNPNRREDDLDEDGRVTNNILAD
ncbi:hypothetical protein GGR52DRAFT_544280 [Hypoxylon sp. FL1284]|nr:hypothetical protein GGR52DRAFT_544280 [Hypoxylon sp. FL1284]